MPAHKGTQPPGGSRLGKPNKSSAAVKQAILEAFDKAGGVSYLIKVSNEDHKTFCTLLGRILPTEIKGELEHGVSNDVKTLMEMIAANGCPRPPASV